MLPSNRERCAPVAYSVAKKLGKNFAVIYSVCRVAKSNMVGYMQLIATSCFSVFTVLNECKGSTEDTSSNLEAVGEDWDESESGLTVWANCEEDASLVISNRISV